MAEQQFCLRWNNFQTNIVSSFETLRDREELVDVTLTAEGKSLKAHRVLLSACSPYFRDLFRDLPAHQHPVIVLRDTGYQELKSLLSFIYHGEVNVSEDRLGLLLKLAEALRIKGLAQDKRTRDLEQLLNNVNISPEKTVDDCERGVCSPVLLPPPFAGPHSLQLGPPPILLASLDPLSHSKPPTSLPPQQSPPSKRRKYSPHPPPIVHLLSRELGSRPPTPPSTTPHSSSDDNHNNGASSNSSSNNYVSNSNINKVVNLTLGVDIAHGSPRLVPKLEDDDCSLPSRPEDGIDSEEEPPPPLPTSLVKAPPPHDEDSHDHYHHAAPSSVTPLDIKGGGGAPHNATHQESPTNSSHGGLPPHLPPPSAVQTYVPFAPSSATSSKLENFPGPSGVLTPVSQAGWRGGHSEPSESSAQVETCKRNSCPLCNCMLESVWALKDHLARRHDMKVHKCGYCGAKFREVEQMAVHMSKRHGEKLAVDRAALSGATGTL